jgi:ATP/maltotriose-dependent transcriptional regulator MalT
MGSGPTLFILGGQDMATKREIEDALKNYAWMIHSIKMLRDSLTVGEGLTAQYGDEAGQPKAQGITGDPIYREAIRREKRHKMIEVYKYKVSIIQDRIHLISEDREKEVLHWLLEGKSFRWIGQHMGLSSTHIHRIKQKIVEKMGQR